MQLRSSNIASQRRLYPPVHPQLLGTSEIKSSLDKPVRKILISLQMLTMNFTQLRQPLLQ
jgi:hypothetical protein